MASSNLILNNFWWKLFSVVLAGIVWLAIYTEVQRKEKTDEEAKQHPVTTTSSKPFPVVPITFLSAVTNTNHYKLTPDSISLNVSGDEKPVQNLQLADIQAFVDLRDVQDEKQFLKLIQIRLPPGISNSPLVRSNVSVERLTVPK